MDDSFTIVLDDRDVLSGVCGANDENLKVIEASLGGRISTDRKSTRLNSSH